VKDVYNKSGTIQSTKFTCDVVSPNVIPLYHAVNTILRSSGAPTYGYKHARVDDLRDVKAIVAVLLEQKVFSYTPGRDISVEAHLRAIPAVDLYCAGADALAQGNVLDRYVTMKLAHSAGEAGGLEQEHTSSGEGMDEESDGIFGTRELIWSFGDEGADGEQSDEFSIWE
jgi:hypothetical protein